MEYDDVCYPAETPDVSIYNTILDFFKIWVPSASLPVRLNRVIHDFNQYYGKPVCVDFDELFAAIIESNMYKYDSVTNTVDLLISKETKK